MSESDDSDIFSNQHSTANAPTIEEIRAASASMKRIVDEWHDKLGKALHECGFRVGVDVSLKNDQMLVSPAVHAAYMRAHAEYVATHIPLTTYDPGKAHPIWK